MNEKFLTLDLKREKISVLLVGEHPATRSGNSMMMEGVLKQIDRSRFDATLFLMDAFAAMDTLWSYSYGPFKDIVGSYIPASDGGNVWGPKKLLSMMKNMSFDIIVFVGIDVWRYSLIEEEISKISENDKMKWVHIFPYDLQYTSRVWSLSIERIQFPYVYSQWGYDMLKDSVPKIKYFRPPNGNEFFYEKKEIPRRNPTDLKEQFFPDKNPENLFVFGTIAPPQKRKNLLRQIQAFSRMIHDNEFLAKVNEVHGKEMEFIYYMHTEENEQYLNFRYLLNEWDIPEDCIRTKPPNSTLTKEMMPIILQMVDCLLNCSLQEGLSWTVLEAMILGVPVIASDSTAHKELLEDIGILVVPYETDFLTIASPIGPAEIETKACSAQSIEKAMQIHLLNPKDIEENKTKAMEKAQEWISGISSINELLDHVSSTEPDRNIEGEML